MTIHNLDAMPKSLLTVGNPKTAKGEKSGYLTAILHLAPHKLSGVANVCSHASDACIHACLNTAGRGGIGLDEDGLNIIQVARIRRTRYFKRDQANFMVDLADEIAQHILTAQRHKLTPAIRLNGTSDLPWENIKVGAFPNIFAMFPDVQFYDYTKVPPRLRKRAAAIPNYHLTFSLSESNDKVALQALAAGMNVAVVFNTRKSQSLPRTFAFEASRLSPLKVADTFDVIDGDKSDLRFLDGNGLVVGKVVGLRAKGRARKDTTGFVRTAN